LDNLPDQRVGRRAPNAKWPTTAPSPPNRMEVSVHTSYEHWQSPETQTGPCVSFINIEGQTCDKSHGMNLSDDVESGAGKLPE